MGGVARRNWARNKPAIYTSIEWNMKNAEKGHITIPFVPGDVLVEKYINDIL
jgi:urocanate hydratase